MNALFVGGGRRVELAWKFLDAGYTVYSYELDHRVPIASVAKIVEGLRWDDDNIIVDLMNVITENDIRLVIPLMDAGVPICARLPEIMGVTVLTPSPVTADLCYDKAQFHRFMSANFPLIYPSADGKDFPWIAKPRFGFGSKHIISIENAHDWDRFTEVHKTKDFVFQKKVDGDEYSVDAYFDKAGNFVDAVPRRRLRIGSGEVITSLTKKDFDLEQGTKLIGEKLGLVGPVNVQFIKVRGTSIVYNFEVNCRFGGGWTLSMEAGLDAISLIDRDYFGLEFDYKPRKWKNGLLLERSYRDHYYETNN
jgi:carbamoyl-phosphate synthase large subunit